MFDPFNKLARMLRTKPAVLLALEQKMNALTGQEGVFEDIVRQNDITVAQTLAGLGLTMSDQPQAVRQALTERIGHFDRHLYDLLDKPDLMQMSMTCGKLCQTALQVFTPPKGMFLKHDKAIAALESHPPTNLLEHFGYATVRDLIDNEGFASVMASLRFTQTTAWMHTFFEAAYSDLTADDFQERDVELLVLDPKWLAVAEKFLEHKYHNVSHLKEFGIIFIIPITLDMAGETLRLFTLLLHYLHEVPFYAGLFRRFLDEGADFSAKFKSLLRGDVPTGPLPDGVGTTWRVVQRYLAKDDANDPRLFEPHVNPEADHWRHAQDDLGRLSRILGRDHGSLDLGWWAGLDFVGDLFTDPVTGTDELVSFDLIDLLISLARKSHTGYLYHQQEALWNKIFSEYMGRDRLEELIGDHIVDGFITLQ